MSDTDWALMLRLAIEKNERERMAKEAESRAGYDPGMTHSRPGSMAPQNQAQQRIRDGWSVEDAYSVPELSLDQRIGQALGNWIDDRTATEAISMLPIPGISDAAGLKADAEYFAKNPDAATPGNVALSAAGLLPFIPGVTVWHGSPHKWDKPNISKVGTGEGAQAYGHGFYSAESPDVAKGYQESVKDMGAITDINADLSRLAKIMERDSVAGQYRKFRSDVGRQAANEYDAIMAARSNVANSPGYLYKLDIPDEDIEKYLNWDRPLSDQPEILKRLLDAGIETHIKTEWAKHWERPAGERLRALRFGQNVAVVEDDGSFVVKKGAWPWEGESVSVHSTLDGAKKAAEALPQPSRSKTGQQIYSDLKREMLGYGPIDESAVIVSDRLSSAGIPGIRYLDGISRKAGEGSYNYVTFDPMRIDVIDRK